MNDLIEHMRKYRLALVNQSERYGEKVEVHVDDYRELNPNGKFEEVGKLGNKKIVEHLDDGSTEVLAEIVLVERERFCCPLR